MELIKNYENAVNAIIENFKKKQGIESNNGYWISDCVGEVYDFDGDCTFDFRDIITDVKENAEKEEIFKWREYVLRIWNINSMVNGNLLHDVNYRSWLKGCPRLTDEELDKIEKKWKGLVDEIAELGKETMKNKVANKF